MPPDATTAAGETADPVPALPGEDGRGGAISGVPLRLELEHRYLAYALSTIISRSLPDVRDGLKPVHRRILFAMRALHLDPGTGFKKSARVVGDVIGKFHPHGDQAAYDAMVRLAQGFAVRYPLVDGQGNFGNIDGDRAAAMRYTEARLTRVAMALLDDLDRDAVDFVPTYDGSQDEPMILPARFPNLLANGSTGIAVGMSTSIPPHNVGEVLDAALRLIDRPETTVHELLATIPGPDFPTGGILASERGEIEEIYTQGRGTLRVRCRWQKEVTGRGGWQIVVTEIPYQVQKGRLIEQIAQLITNRQSPFLADVRDESDACLRIVLEPRTRTLEAEKIMAYLYRHSDLEVRFPVNFNVITADLRPMVLDLKGMLTAWLDHRFRVWTRCSRFERGRLLERLHVLVAFLLVHLNLDEVIAIIKEHDEPGPVLMSRFQLDELQAEAVLNLRLRSLRRLEEMAIRREMAEKEARVAVLDALLADDGAMWQAIRGELVATRSAFADARRTEWVEAAVEIALKPEELVQREPVTVVLSRKGWVRALKGHDVVPEKLRFKHEDGMLFTERCYSNDMVTFVMATGKVFSLLADRLPSGQSAGDPLGVVFDVDGEDRVDWMAVVESGAEYFVATRLAQGFRIRGGDLVSTQRKGKKVFDFRADDALLGIQPVGDATWLASICSGRRMLLCRMSEFPVLARGKGVRIQRLLRGETLLDLIPCVPEQGITLDSGKRTRLLTDLALWMSQRSTRGAMLPHGFLGGTACFQGSCIASPQSLLALAGSTPGMMTPVPGEMELSD